MNLGRYMFNVIKYKIKGRALRILSTLAMACLRLRLRKVSTISGVSNIVES